LEFLWAPRDVPRDTPTDIARDVPRDLGVDAPVPRDVGVDAPVARDVVAVADVGERDRPAPVDVGSDVGVDAGEEVADATVDAPPMEEPGCGCRTLPTRGGAPNGWLVALLVAGLSRRRASRTSG